MAPGTLHVWPLMPVLLLPEIHGGTTVLQLPLLQLELVLGLVPKREYWSWVPPPTCSPSTYMATDCGTELPDIGSGGVIEVPVTSS
jgi:hypothetical protein